MSSVLNLDANVTTLILEALLEVIKMIPSMERQTDASFPKVNLSILHKTPSISEKTDEEVAKIVWFDAEV